MIKKTVSVWTQNSLKPSWFCHNQEIVFKLVQIWYDNSLYDQTLVHFSARNIATFCQKKLNGEIGIAGSGFHYFSDIRNKNRLFVSDIFKVIINDSRNLTLLFSQIHSNWAIRPSSFRLSTAVSTARALSQSKSQWYVNWKNANIDFLEIFI